MKRVLKILQAKSGASSQIDWEGVALHSTDVKAHRTASGAHKAAAKAEKRGQ